MRRIAKFHKVSEAQFVEGFLDCFAGKSEIEAKEIYNTLKLPRRATAGSAGYDFFSPGKF